MAVCVLIADQANKLWLIFIYEIALRQPIRVTPFFDIVYAKNPGISYSLLRANTDFGRWALLGGTFIATVLIAIWLWHAHTRLVGLGLGLIVGGALGNECDRLLYGAVADFYYFHLGSFSWYIFNLADCAIVAGVFLLLYDSFLAGPARNGKGSDPSLDAIASKTPRTKA